MRPTIFLALASLIVGCDENPTEAIDTLMKKQAWIGSYSGASGQGDVVIDLTQTGSAVTGGVVYGSPAVYYSLSGSIQSDSVSLIHASPSPSDFTLSGRILADGSLAGTMMLPSAGFSADLSCRAVARRRVDVDEDHSVPFSVSGVVYDGDRLWLSTLTDYVRMNLNGSIVDTIVIYHNPPLARWTSDVVLYDGAVLWGVYPITIMGPGGSTNVADLLGFTASGRTADSLRLEHRPQGLAHDGSSAWSLRSEPPALIRFDGTGAATDSLPVEVPDAYRLIFDGTSFWTLGWNLKRLYQLDASGQVVSICDLPASGLEGIPAGLAVEGSAMWYAEAGISTARLHRMTIK